MERLFEPQVEYREDLDTHEHWHWIKGETGLWGSPREHFPEYVRMFLKYLPSTTQRRVIVQAGGGLGMYPRLWADHFETVYTFEPDPLNFYCLSLNCQKPNIFKFQAALSDKHGMTHMSQADRKNTGEHSIVTDRIVANPKIFVPQLTIDDLELEHCDAIQLDVEGAEHMVLRGAEKTIARCKPIISVETIDMDFFNAHGYMEVEKYVYDTLFVTADRIK